MKMKNKMNYTDAYVNALKNEMQIVVDSKGFDMSKWGEEDLAKFFNAELELHDFGLIPPKVHRRYFQLNFKNNFKFFAKKIVMLSIRIIQLLMRTYYGIKEYVENL